MKTATTTRGRARRARRDRDSGAALVEMAIVVPLLAVMLFGIVEYGTMISKNLALSGSTRAGARVGAQEGNQRDADYDILKAVENSRGFMSLNSIESVVVYKSADAQGEVPEDCKAGVAVPGVCNVYPASAFGMTPDDLYTNAMSTNWPATSRVLGTDYIGVWVIAEHSWLTSLFSSTPTEVADSAVMRIEPAMAAPWTPPGGVAGTTSTSAPATTQKPTTTSNKPSTTKKPTSTTKKPTATTKKPGATTTTKKPTSTTKKPTTTTKKPSTSTTKKPTTTTKKPTSTTKKPATTTSTTKGGGGYF
jgi:Flp pilus assembly protein TadG